MPKLFFQLYRLTYLEFNSNISKTTLIPPQSYDEYNYIFISDYLVQEGTVDAIGIKIYISRKFGSNHLLKCTELFRF